jgi:hypothetical protein
VADQVDHLSDQNGATSAASCQSGGARELENC